MKRSTTRRGHGFTLLETLISLAILLILIMGLLSAMGLALGNISAGQGQQYKAALSEATTQARMLSSRQPLVNAQNYPGAALDTYPIDDDHWAVDPAGAFFTVTPNGEVKELDALNGAVKKCGDAEVPVGTYCREVGLVRGMPNGDVAPIAAFGGFAPQAYTLWTRVSRKGESPARAHVHREVIVQ